MPAADGRCRACGTTNWASNACCRRCGAALPAGRRARAQSNSSQVPGQGGQVRQANGGRSRSRTARANGQKAATGLAA
eukprot:5208792-Lingulodinium_polyedra.AAC.1